MEFNQLYHWHGLMPDSFIIQGQEYSYEQFLYNTSMLMDYGVEALVESFSKQIAGRVRSCCPLLASAGAVGPREGCSWRQMLLCCWAVEPSSENCRAAAGFQASLLTWCKAPVQGIACPCSAWSTAVAHQ